MVVNIDVFLEDIDLGDILVDMGGFYSLIGKVVSCDVVFLFNVFVFYEYNGNIDYVVMNGDGVF